MACFKAPLNGALMEQEVYLEDMAQEGSHLMGPRL
jgi:hypothetical protein